MKIQELAKEARASISDFCMEECGAYCCRKGYLLLSNEETDLLTGEKRAELEESNDIKPQENNTFSLHLGNKLGSCPMLDGVKCTIHKNPKRPSPCSTFPIFINEAEKTIRLSPRCLAVKQMKLYNYEHQFLQAGFTINKL